MHVFTVKFKPFSSNNRGGLPHIQVHQSEIQRQRMLDLIEDFQQLHDALPQLHHNKKLRKTGNDPKQTQKWHKKQLTKNHAGRRSNPSNLLYQADILRHNNLIEDCIAQLDALGNTDQTLIQLLNNYWILAEENKKFSSASIFNKLVK